MSRTFLSCLAVFIVALYAFFNAAFSTGVRFTAAAVLFVIVCATIGLLLGEIFGRSWRLFLKSRGTDARKPTNTPGDRL